MKSQPVAQYDAPHQFEPLMPAQGTGPGGAGGALEPLLEKAGTLTRAAVVLGRTAGPQARRELGGLLRAMNSYYTNRIEGEHTRPSEIDQALQQDFSSNADLARKQRLAVAHIRAEERCEALVDAQDKPAPWLYSSAGLCTLHQQLFSDLTPADLRLADGSLLQPGALRQRAVAVGRHEAPSAAALPRFINRWSEVYGGTRQGEASVVALAAAHHRLTWMHPFLDGNGRAARLHTHLLLRAVGLTDGLWSPLRGFARSEARYKSLLQAADEHRRGDLDGRGNLTQAGLVDWIDYTLDLCIDQVQFMSQQLDAHGMRGRIEAALTFEESTSANGVRREALIPLHYLFATQTELGRAEFKTLTGLGDRLATQTVSALLKRGFLASDTPYGAVRFAVPQHALRFYFPALWPEAEQDQALLQAERRGAKANS
jgi:Fic family protein